jgi:glycosyltransferase involved in cell wall biosynthesis
MKRASLDWLDKCTAIVALPERLLNRSLNWFLASRWPTAVFVREFIRRNDFLRRCARVFVRVVQRFAALPRRLRTLYKSARERQLAALLDARAVGGAITVSELEQIWHSIKTRRARVLCVAEGLEREQIKIVLAAARVEAKYYQRSGSIPIGEVDPNDGDIVIAVPGPGLEKCIAALERKVRSPGRFLLVGTKSKRSEYLGLTSAHTQAARRSRRPRKPTADKLACGEPLSVVFLNDIGFQDGAGIALKRQVASLLLKGCNVSVVAWSTRTMLNPTFVTGIKRFENWCGIHGLGDVHSTKGLHDAAIAKTLAEKVRSLSPDVVIVGNLHGAGWPLASLRSLKSQGICVVAYMHDTYFLTGRCAQPLSCTLYRTGCDERCPTSNEHPRLAPEMIAPAWRERGLIFTGPQRIPLVGNSHWIRNMAVQRFGATATTEVVHLGLDHEMFAPMPKSIAQRLLGISGDKVIIAMGAVDLHNPWKGGALFHELLKALVERDDVRVILFGHSPEKLPCAKALGLIRDERMMPLILNAADIYVSTANAESFGQLLLEASACALPVVAFNVGGVNDVVVDGETGILVDQQILPDLLAAIDRLLISPAERQRMGRNGRRRVENNFTLIHQGNAWINCLMRIC